MIFTRSRSLFGILVAIAASMIVGHATADTISDAKWINLLYADTLGRSPTGPELSAIQTELGMGTPRITVALEILQLHEFDAITVQNAYQLYLHRAADSFGLNTFVAQLQTGTRDENVFASLISSNEYFTSRANNDNAMFVNAIYQDVLNRTPSLIEVSNAVTAIQNTSRATYTLSVLTSAEARGVFVSDWYQLYLTRTPATPEQSAFVSAIAGGATFDQVRSQILGSLEFYNLAQQIPEMQTSVLFGIGSLLLAWVARRRC